MREQKFRGLDTQGIWHYGDLIHTKHFAYILNTNFLPAKSIPSNQFIEVDSETIGQYTGLKDKNGKEIYEGDILGIKQYDQFISTKFVVKWNKLTAKYQAFQFLPESITQDKLSTVGIDFNCMKTLKDCDYEIICNIHENPELQ